MAVEEVSSLDFGFAGFSLSIGSEGFSALIIKGNLNGVLIIFLVCEKDEEYVKEVCEKAEEKAMAI